ncbi:hypothetical protein SAMN06265173_101106 [Thalassovita litoralis]|jgi:hypothetical protein|uniref:Uncharacterized protein n=1 Tax=Thalassovita litoralis TaxID=1010611 RepID=A0A521AEE8_9RHOB|nr:hypothetical protein [Thalassovita litoralis]SMO33146.1 hypothetical protein SAMN06265173_101106 [Thalassovita litoralis]
MSDLKLTKTRLFEGVWEGFLTSASMDNLQPELEVTHLNEPVLGLEMTEDRENGHWVVRVPVPVQALSDGVQTFLIRDKRTGEALDSFAILAGEALSDDIRAEVTLLREELDMLKRAFRRYCVENS